LSYSTSPSSFTFFSLPFAAGHWMLVSEARDASALPVFVNVIFTCLSFTSRLVIDTLHGSPGPVPVGHAGFAGELWSDGKVTWLAE
jgi:hypothetical protein